MLHEEVNLFEKVCFVPAAELLIRFVDLTSDQSSGL